MNFETGPNIETQTKEETWLERVRKYYQGDFHAHSLRSSREEIDGSRERMVHGDSRLMQYADKLGLDFVFFSEHSSSPGNPKKLSPDHPICQSLLDQKERVDDINKSGKYRPKAFSAVEANIFFDNNKPTVDVPDSVLSQLDLVIASRHAIADKLEPKKIKESFLGAINNSQVDIIGHPYRGIEFYENDWNYFKKYYRQDKEISEELEALEKNKEWDKIKQIIGKKEADDEGMANYHLMFTSLKSEYWDAWEDILQAMEEKGKCFELNLSSFNPGKEFYKTLLSKAAKYKNLNFSITYDFHNLGQLDNYDNKDYDNDVPDDIKNPARGKGVQRLLQLITLLESNNIGTDRIVNSSVENLEKFINTNRKLKNI